jgi:hypothetical protein
MCVIVNNAAPTMEVPQSQLIFSRVPHKFNGMPIMTNGNLGYCHQYAMYLCIGQTLQN